MIVDEGEVTTDGGQLASNLRQRTTTDAACAVLWLEGEHDALTGDLPARWVRRPARILRDEFHQALRQLIAREVDQPAPAPEAGSVEGPLRILFAEDNAINTTFTVALLRMYGYEVDHAENGRAALALAEIRKDTQAQALNARTPAIVVTADAMMGARARMLAAGFDDYLSKPFRAEELKTIIDRWTHGRSASASAAL